MTGRWGSPGLGRRLATVTAAAAVTAAVFSWYIRGFEQGGTWFPDARGYVVFLPHALLLLILLSRAPAWLAMVVAGVHGGVALVMVPVFGFGLAMLPGAFLLLVAAVDALSQRGADRPPDRSSSVPPTDESAPAATSDPA